MIRYAFIALIAISLIVPFYVANATVPQENYNYTPRVGGTLEYRGVVTDVGIMDRGLTNVTLEMNVNVTLSSYAEAGMQAVARAQYRGTYALYVNGTFQTSVPLTESKDLRGPAFIGVIDEDYALFVAANVSNIPIGLYLASIELTPTNFSARLIDYNGEKALKIVFNVQDEETVVTGELVFLLRYGVYAYEDLYVTSLDTAEFLHAKYELVNIYEVEPIEGGIDYPSERVGMQATREVTNGTQSMTVSSKINDVFSVGGAIFVDFTAQISGYMPITISRSSTLGYTPTGEEPFVVIPFLFYPPALDELAEEENATLVNVTVSGKIYEAYKFVEGNDTLIIIKDLGILYQFNSETENVSITLTSLSVPSSTGGEEGGENEESGASSGLSAQQSMIIIVAVIAILLALVALLLSRRG